MGRYLGSSCKYCRREGMKLMLKGTRCETGKCAVERRERHMAPGQHGWKRARRTDYGIRLREKQKVKRFYGLLDKQFMRYFRKAERRKGNTGEVLLELLEMRYDNVIYKLNFAPSRKAARQLISHGHVHINGRKVDIPDYAMKVGDRITLKSNSRTEKLVKDQLATNTSYTTQGWLQLDADKPSATVVGIPSRDDVQLVVEEQLVVEFCSK